MLFVLDNYDSFTYNLVQYFGELGAEPVVYRNDALTVEQVLALKPAAAVISPGPKTPAEADICVPLVRALAGQVPVLGVCLGHQAIAEAFGGKVVRATRLMHGKTCEVEHEEDELFEGVPVPFTAMRYHSLVAERDTLPPLVRDTQAALDRLSRKLQGQLPADQVPPPVLAEGISALAGSFGYTFTVAAVLIALCLGPALLLPRRPIASTAPGSAPSDAPPIPLPSH